MSVALLLVRQGGKVLLDLEPDDRGRGVGEVLRELLGVHVEESAGLLQLREGNTSSGGGEGGGSRSQGRRRAF